MSKDVAIFRDVPVERIVTAIGIMGFSLRNPSSGVITGISADGMKSVACASPSEALSFLTRGAGLSFWKNDSEDLFLSRRSDAEEFCVYFDGYTDREAQEIRVKLRSAGLPFTVVKE